MFNLFIPHGSNPLSTLKTGNTRCVKVAFDRAVKGNILQMEGDLSQSRVALPKGDDSQSSLQLGHHLIGVQVFIPATGQFLLEMSVSHSNLERMKLSCGTFITKADVTDVKGVPHVKLPMAVPRNVWAQIIFHVPGIFSHLFDLPSVKWIDSIILAGSVKVKRIFSTSDEAQSLESRPSGMLLFTFPAYATPLWKTAGAPLPADESASENTPPQRGTPPPAPAPGATPERKKGFTPQKKWSDEQQQQQQQDSNGLYVAPESQAGIDPRNFRSTPPASDAPLVIADSNNFQIIRTAHTQMQPDSLGASPQGGGGGGSGPKIRFSKGEDGQISFSATTAELEAEKERKVKQLAAQMEMDRQLKEREAALTRLRMEQEQQRVNTNTTTSSSSGGGGGAGYYVVNDDHQASPLSASLNYIRIVDSEVGGASSSSQQQQSSNAVRSSMQSGGGVGLGGISSSTSASFTRTGGGGKRVTSSANPNLNAGAALGGSPVNPLYSNNSGGVGASGLSGQQNASMLGGPGGGGVGADASALDRMSPTGWGDEDDSNLGLGTPVVAPSSNAANAKGGKSLNRPTWTSAMSSSNTPQAKRGDQPLGGPGGPGNAATKMRKPSTLARKGSGALGSSPTNSSPRGSKTVGGAILGGARYGKKKLLPPSALMLPLGIGEPSDRHPSDDFVLKEKPAQYGGFGIGTLDVISSVPAIKEAEDSDEEEEEEEE